MTRILKPLNMLGLLVLLLMPTQMASSRSHVTLDKGGNVERFYGIPLKVTEEGLKQLPFTVKVTYRMGEDGRVPIYCLTGKDAVQIRLEFESGHLYLLETDSKNAVGPKGIHVGSSLREVRKAWPKGKLLFGQEEGGFVTYVSGTNVLYLFNHSLLRSVNLNKFDPKSDGSDIKVSTIRILVQSNPVP